MIIDISEILLNTGRSNQYTVSYGTDIFSYSRGDYEVVSSEPFTIEIVSPS